jgi:membrane protein
MFDGPPDCDNAIMARAWSLAGFVLLVLGVLVSAGSSILSRVIQAHVDSWFGGSAASAFAIRGATAIVGVVIDAAIVASIILVVARVVPKSRRDLIVACLAVGVVSAGLRWVGTSVVVGSSAHNALLAPFAVIVTILVLVNFLARLLLYASAWIFDPPRLQRGASSASGVGKQEAVEDEAADSGARVAFDDEA